jgi:hypothetical protein
MVDISVVIALLDDDGFVLGATQQVLSLSNNQPMEPKVSSPCCSGSQWRT